MVVILGQEYNVGEKPIVILYTYIDRHAGPPLLLLLLFFLAFSVLVANPEKLLNKVANSVACGLLNKETRVKRGSLAAAPHLQGTEKRKRKEKKRTHKAHITIITKIIDGRKGATSDVSTCLGAKQVSARLVPVQDFFGSSTRPIIIIVVASEVLRFHVRWEDP